MHLFACSAVCVTMDDGGLLFARLININSFLGGGGGGLGWGRVFLKPSYLSSTHEQKRFEG